MKIGCCVKQIEDIEKIQALGYDGYEFPGYCLGLYTDAEFSELYNTAQALSFPCLGINAYSAGEPVIAGPRYSPAKISAYAQRLCKRAAALGAKGIGIGAPKARQLPDDFSRAVANEQLKAFLHITADTAQAYGLAVHLESLQKNICNYINLTQEALEIIEAVDKPNVGLVYDFYHVKASGEDQLERVYALAKQIAHVHVSSKEGRVERGFPTPADLPEYTAVFKALHAIGYAGAVCIEPDAFDYKLAEAALGMLRQAYSRGNEKA